MSILVNTPLQDVKQRLREKTVPRYVERKLRRKLRVKIPKRYMWAYRNTGKPTGHVVDRLAKRVTRLGGVEAKATHTNGGYNRPATITVRRKIPR